MSAPLPRKLAAILSADAENFSGRMGEDEAAAFEALQIARDIIDTRILSHGGRIANTAGDGLIAEFPSVVQAVRAAVEMQQGLAKNSNALPFRIGLHMGDVITHGEDLLGDGVNLAARVQAHADPGAVLVTQQVYDQMHGKVDYGFVSVGAVPLKNMQDPVQMFSVDATDIAVMTAKAHEVMQVAPVSAKSLQNFAIVCAGIWAALALRSLIFGTSVAATWIGLAVAVVMITRAVPRLGLPKAAEKTMRPALILACGAAALVLAGIWAFWVVMPAVAYAAYLAVLKLRA